MEAQTPFPSRAPDACKFLAPRGSLSEEQFYEAVEIAERLLQIDLTSTVSAWVRAPSGGKTHYFATRSADDTEFFPIGHPREKQPRYVWQDLGNGEMVGWLRDD